jgi:two-component system KDP operon response regulator KdpE
MNTQEDRKTVLIVDDDSDFLFQQRVQLENAGFHVISAANTGEAERLLEQQRPDIAVVDLMMDNVDAGFTLCYHIRKRDPSIPVILVSSVNSETGLQFDTSTDEERSWIKADAFLAKPIRFEQLKQEIDRLVQD